MTYPHNFSIKNKLVLIILSVSVSTLLIGFAVIILTDINQLRNDLLGKTALDASIISKFYVFPLIAEDKGGGDELLSDLKKDLPNVENGFLYNEKGELFTSYHKTKRVKPPKAPHIDMEKYEGDYIHVCRTLSFKHVKYGAVYLMVSTESLKKSIRKKILFMIMILMGLIVLSYLLALRLQGMISHRILKLARVTERISSQSDYSVRVQKDGADEIGVLYDGFNNMLEQIQLGQQRRDEAEAEQKRLLAELGEKNKELEQVIYVTSHDLRSPLVNIQGFSQELGFSLQELGMILKDIENIPESVRMKLREILDEDIQESLKYIEASTTKMDGLLSGLLKLSRVDRILSNFDMISMNRLIDDILNAFEFQLKEAGVKIEVSDLPPCFGIEMQVNQVFSNLVSNALKYRDPSRPGIVQITGREVPENNSVVYCVEDNGIGIPQEYHKKIFEIFHRLNPDETEGEGLGLAIVSKIISRHKGSIWVESEPGVGTKFFVSFSSTAAVLTFNNSFKH
ncbi:MAG: sensor histidine kinase [Candidatus Omnitrophota bacterium]